jgi:hypothetical protein
MLDIPMVEILDARRATAPMSKHKATHGQAYSFSGLSLPPPHTLSPFVCESGVRTKTQFIVVKRQYLDTKPPSYSID